MSRCSPALLLHLAESGACDRDFIGARTSGFAAAVEAARASVPSLAEAARIADVAPGDLAQFFDWFAGTERSVTLYSQGVNQSSAGTDKVNAIINCHLATGRIGRPGMGPFSLTGQPNAMGGREVGGLANQLAAHMSFRKPADIDRVRRFWNAPHMATRPGLKAVELFDAMLDGRVKALWVLGTNPAASMPRAARVREALAACPFVVVSDCWPTDTTRFADVVSAGAPAGARRTARSPIRSAASRASARFRAPPGEARPDWWMLTEIARRHGLGGGVPVSPPGRHLPRARRAVGFRERRARGRSSTSARWPDLSDDEYDALPPRAVAAAARRLRRGRGRGCSALRRGISDRGRRGARFVPTPYRPPAAGADKHRPLLLNTGRIRDQWHTMTRTGRLDV